MSPRRLGAAAWLQSPEVVRWGPVWGRRVGQVIDHVVWHTTVIGAEHVPATGPVILAANHTGVLDGPVLHGACPRASHIIVKQEMFTGVLGVVLRWSGQIPVDRRSGRAALTAALTLLGEGRVVGIFPEGTRGTGDVASAQAGIAWLALRSGAPVVPVAILGTRPEHEGVDHVPKLRSRLWVVFGEPFQAAPTDAGTGRAALGAAMERIQAELSSHVAGAKVSTSEPDQATRSSAAAASGPPTTPLRYAGHVVRTGRHLAASPADVWAVLTDLDAAPSTLRDVTAVEVLTKGSYRVGTRWRETRRVLGKEETQEMWVVESEPGRRTVIAAGTGSARYRTRFELTAAGDGTQVDVTFGARTLDPTRRQRLTWAIFGAVGGWVTRKALARDLKDIEAAARQRAGSS